MSSANRLTKKRRIASSQNKENNENEHMWAAIEWVPKKNSDTIEYSTVHVSDFADPKYKNGDISTLKTGIEYSVRYNGIKYKGKLCLTGTMKACDDLVDSYVSYGVDKNLRGNIQKNNKRPYDEISKEKDSMELNLLQSENAILNRKFAELEEKVSQYESDIAEKDRTILSKEHIIAELNIQLQQQQSEKKKDYCIREHLISVANHIYNTVGKTEDLTNLALASNYGDQNDAHNVKMTIISKHYTNYKMPLHLKQNIVALSKHPNKTATQLFRNIVKPLVNDESKRYENPTEAAAAAEKIWAENNAESMKSKYPILIACYDFINELRPSFTNQDFQIVLTGICSEARRNIAKLTKNASNSVLTQSPTSIDLTQVSALTVLTQVPPPTEALETPSQNRNNYSQVYVDHNTDYERITAHDDDTTRDGFDSF